MTFTFVDPNGTPIGPNSRVRLRNWNPGKSDKSPIPYGAGTGTVLSTDLVSCRALVRMDAYDDGTIPGPVERLGVEEIEVIPS